MFNGMPKIEILEKSKNITILNKMQWLDCDYVARHILRISIFQWLYILKAHALVMNITIFMLDSYIIFYCEYGL